MTDSTMPTAVRRGFRALLTLCALSMLWLAGTPSARAQSTLSIEVRVTQLAGDQVYLEWLDELDPDQFPTAGDTLRLFRESVEIGSLSVIAVAAPRLVTEFLDARFALTRGEQLMGRWGNGQTGREALVVSPSQDDPDPEPADTTATPRSILERTPTGQPVREVDGGGTGGRASTRADRRSMQIRGRILTGATLTQSTTRWSRVLDASDQRLSAIPFTSLSLQLLDLPGDWDVQVQGRYTYRWQTDSRINATGLANIYNLNAHHRFRNVPLEVQMGRFYNRFEARGAYWDGAMVHWNDRRWGIGLLGGWEPDRSNEGIQTELPKTGAFVHLRARTEELRWYGQVNGVSAFPSQAETHHVLGLKQKLDYRAISLDGEFQLENDPESNQWKTSRAQVRLDVQVTDWLELSGDANRRTPFLLRSDRGFFLERRDRYGASAFMRFDAIWVSAGVRLNERSTSRSTSTFGRVQWNESPLFDITWSLFGNLWHSDAGSSWNAGVNASRGVGIWQLSSGLNAYQTSFSGYEQLSGSLNLTATARISRTFSMNLRYIGSYSELMMRNSLNFSLWKSF